MIRFKLEELIEIEDRDVSIIKYDETLHHDIIPILYAKGFHDKKWEDTWDDIDEFDKNGVFLLKKEEYIGFIISFRRKDYGYISVLTVLPGYRRKGYAKLLIKEAVKYLHSISLKDIYLDVKKDNIEAISLYKKLGFKESEDA